MGRGELRHECFRGAIATMHEYSIVASLIRRVEHEMAVLTAESPFRRDGTCNG